MTKAALSQSAIDLAIRALKEEELCLYEWQQQCSLQMIKTSMRVPVWQQSRDFLSAMKQRDRMKARRAKVIAAVKELKAQR